MARLIVFGRGGHFRDIFDMFCHSYDVVPVGRNEKFDTLPDDHYAIAIGLGIDMKLPRDRIRLFTSYSHERFPTMIHPTAWVSPSAELGRGVQVMAGCIVGPNVEIGDNVILGTGTQLSHDCRIGDHCVLGPAVVLCGTVILGHSCVLGVRSTVVQQIELPPETRVPGGTLVVSKADWRKPGTSTRD